MPSRRGHGEGSIYRRASDGRWCCVVDLGWIEGKRKRKVLYGKTRKEVAEKLKVTLRAQQQGLPIATERQTVAQFLERWLAEVVQGTVRERTHALYAQAVRIYIAPAIGQQQLDKLTPQHVQGMINGLSARGLAPGTVRGARAVLARALGQALKWGLVVRNVAMLTDAPRVGRHDFTILDPDQARQFLDAVRGDRLEALYTVALALGLRQGEALGLRWRDVDLDAGALHVRMALQWIYTQEPRLVEPKTARSRRTLPLPPEVAVQLRAHRTRQLEERLRAGADWQGEAWDLVFAEPDGTPIDARHLRHWFKAHLKRAGLAPVRFHDLRHSCASLLVAQGIHPRVVMEILGHSQIAMTMNTYSQAIPESTREALGRLDTLLTMPR
jgi:integrase